MKLQIRLLLLMGVDKLITCKSDKTSKSYFRKMEDVPDPGFDPKINLIK